MLGNESRKIEQKARIILPDFCEARKDDIVVILSKREYIEVWNSEMLKKKLEQTKIDDFTYADNMTAFITLTDVRVDASKRINLTQKLVEDYQLQDGAHIEGKGGFIRIWNQSRFQEYKDGLKRD